MDFTLSKEHEMLRKMYREFAENEVKPLAAELDELERFPKETIPKMAKLGMLGIPFPKEYGGAGGDNLTYAMAVEEVAKTCGTTSVIICAHTSLCCYPIYAYGTEEQKMKYLPDLLSGRKLGAFGLTEPGSDTYATSQIIAAGIDTYGVEEDDIILAGRQAIDGDTAQVGPQIAEKLHLPQVTYAGEIKKNGNTLTVKRMLEDGYMTVKVKTPCMITCIKELNQPRYLSVGGAFEAYSKPLVTMTYETLKDHPLIDKSTIGLAGSPTNILTSFTPPQKGAGMMLEGAGKETCDKLAGILAAKHII